MFSAKIKVIARDDRKDLIKAAGDFNISLKAKYILSSRRDRVVE